MRRYFAGVNAQDAAAIRSCFAATVQLRDMCGLSRGAPRTASRDDMAQRCMEFVAAHPDVEVYFEEPPTTDRHGRCGDETERERDKATQAPTST